jgi:hypothetical protein
MPAMPWRIARHCLRAEPYKAASSFQKHEAPQFLAGLFKAFYQHAAICNCVLSPTSQEERRAKGNMLVIFKRGRGCRPVASKECLRYLSPEGTLLVDPNQGRHALRLPAGC